MTREEEIAASNERRKSYINDRNISVMLTGEEHDYISVMIYHIKNRNPITEKLAEIFKLEPMDRSEIFSNCP